MILMRSFSLIHTHFFVVVMNGDIFSSCKSIVAVPMPYRAWKVVVVPRAAAVAMA